MPEEKIALRKEVAKLKSEVVELRLRLANVTLLLRKEMSAAGKIPDLNKTSRWPDSKQ